MKKNLRQFIALILMPCIWVQACKKPDLNETKKELINGTVTLDMNIEDIYAALPQTVFYNMAKDGLDFYVGRAQWNKGSDYIIVRIPTSQGNNAYIYAVKTLQDPKIKTFLVQYMPTPNSSPSSFTGRQMWIDFQNWHVYGVQFNQGQAVAHLEPGKLIDRDWETCALENGKFGINSSGKIYIKGATAERTANRPTGDTDCPPNPNGGPSFWDNVGDFFVGIGKGIGDIIDGIGDWFGDLFPGGGGPSGGPFPGPGGSWGPGSPPAPGGGGSSGGYTPPSSPDPGPSYPPFWNGQHLDPGHIYWEDLTSTPTPGGPAILDPIYADGSRVILPGRIFSISEEDAMLVRSMLGTTGSEYSWLVAHHRECTEIRDYLIGVSDLTEEEKDAIALEHLQLMMSNPEYYDYVHDYTGHWWDQDSNGYTYSKKKQLEIYIKIKPFGMLSCSDLTENLTRWNMWQEVGGYDIPISVTNRIQSIIDANSPAYTTSNFHILPLFDAIGGVVNCDYFTVHITQLPKNSTGTRMQPDEFLEYFRKTISSFSGTTPFEPYTHFAAGSVNIDETTKYNSAYETSLGAIVHIEIPLDEGTVVQSDYTRNTTTNYHQFKFTTMKAPIDYDHPVSGNREFGIFPDTENGGYCFYMTGVDRITDHTTAWVDALAEIFTGSSTVFGGADDLWHLIQSNLKTYVNTHEGTASSYSPYPEYIRPDMDGALYYFLTGQYTLTDMKAALGCP